MNLPNDLTTNQQYNLTPQSDTFNQLHVKFVSQLSQLQQPKQTFYHTNKPANSLLMLLNVIKAKNKIIKNTTERETERKKAKIK